MNQNFVTIIKRIIAEQGENILANPQALKGFVADYASRESKAERLVFGRCMEHGAYTALKDAPDAQTRQTAKAAVARKVHDNEGLDTALCNDALDALEAAVWGDKRLCKKCGKELQEGWVVCPFCGGGQREAEFRQPQPAAAFHGVSIISEGFVYIKGGMFTMGSPVSEKGRFEDEVQHTVTVSSFCIGKYEVTQREWLEVMGNNPSIFKGDNLPVENVSWYDAVEYCNKRSLKEGLIPAYTIIGQNVRWNKGANGCRLPTEAEWEYACRAGTNTPFNTGNNITTAQANYNGNLPYNNGAGGTYREKTWAVGSGTANAWGLYDMHGNVWEWCWDWYGDYSGAAEMEPTGAVSGSSRVFRGGSWSYTGTVLRSALRNAVAPSYRGNVLGFRLARNGE